MEGLVIPILYGCGDEGYRIAESLNICAPQHLLFLGQPTQKATATASNVDIHFSGPRIHIYVISIADLDDWRPILYSQVKQEAFNLLLIANDATPLMDFMIFHQPMMEKFDRVIQLPVKLESRNHDDTSSFIAGILHTISAHYPDEFFETTTWGGAGVILCSSIFSGAQRIEHTVSDIVIHLSKLVLQSIHPKRVLISVICDRLTVGEFDQITSSIAHSEPTPSSDKIILSATFQQEQVQDKLAVAVMLT
ncbi:MAG: hypothetical protein KJ558_11365 [Gammaproteobacteria bacterium]|nr:hypothetical protein [Gammaproteobacteria bacterium]MBU1655406.1 hypothetical protein [Gammaproteobacteria bacterium]MBU1960814.1 hypothetical protein [Gammaproteobacteria bacterium]